MREYSVETTPQLYARTAGALYLIIIALGIFGEAFVRGSIIVSGDAAATAANLVSKESLWRFGIAAEFLSLACVVTLAMIYFFLLRPVSKELNLLSTLFRMVAITVEAVASLILVSALFPLGSSPSLGAFTREQLDALANLALRAHGDGFAISLLFTGCTFLFHGTLIFRSGYLPRALGVMIQIAGVGYLTMTFVKILYPALAGKVFLATVLPVLVGEGSLSLWLLVKGVDVRKWNERVGLGPSGGPAPGAGVGA